MAITTSPFRIPGALTSGGVRPPQLYDFAPRSNSMFRRMDPWAAGRGIGASRSQIMGNTPIPETPDEQPSPFRDALVAAGTEMSKYPVNRMNPVGGAIAAGLSGFATGVRTKNMLEQERRMQQAQQAGLDLQHKFEAATGMPWDWFNKLPHETQAEILNKNSGTLGIPHTETRKPEDVPSPMLRNPATGEMLTLKQARDQGIPEGWFRGETGIGPTETGAPLPGASPGVLPGLPESKWAEQLAAARGQAPEQNPLDALKVKGQQLINAERGQRLRILTSTPSGKKYKPATMAVANTYKVDPEDVEALGHKSFTSPGPTILPGKRVAGTGMDFGKFVTSPPDTLPETPEQEAAKDIITINRSEDLPALESILRHESPVHPIAYKYALKRYATLTGSRDTGE